MSSAAPVSRPRRIVAAARIDAPEPPTAVRPATKPGPNAAALHRPAAEPARTCTGSSVRSLRPSVARIACWQVIVAAGVTGVATSTWWLAIAATAAGTTAAVPLRGVWLSTLAGRWLRLGLRRGRDLPLGLPAGTAEINGERIGVISRPDALVAVLRAGRAGLPALVGAAFAHHDDPQCELQVVQARRPRPRTWLVVRARRDADNADNADDLTLGVALGNVLRRLRRGGLDLTPLSDREITATVTVLTGTGPVRETWHSWQAGSSTHIGLSVTVPGAAGLHRLILAAGDADLTVAVRPDGDRLTGVLRAGSRTTVDRLLAAAGPGVHLERLDGRHGPAVAASLGIGGTLP